MYFPLLYVKIQLFGREQSLPLIVSRAMLFELRFWFLIQFADAMAAFLCAAELETEARYAERLCERVMSILVKNAHEFTRTSCKVQ